MKRIRTLEISVAIGLVFSIVFSVVGFGVSCSDIRDSVIRLHIIANSDSEADQKIKLAVRDELLESGKEIFSGGMTLENASLLLDEQKDELVDLVDNILINNGYDYKSDIVLVNEYFPTRTYENFTLPAGEYLALKVVLGKGEGHNWWCVMFPPLCLPAAAENADMDAVFNENGAEIVQSSSKYEIRFKIVEIFERIRNRI